MIVLLLVGGGAPSFAYEFTHGVWLMYPYVYLGLLTAVTDPVPGERPEVPADLSQPRALDAP